MKAISRWLDRFCYNHPGFGIPELMKYIAIGNVIVFFGDMVTNGMFSLWTRFYPELILKGQVWRLVTFVFAPVNTGGGSIFTQVLFFALTTYFYYWIGTALERQWGTTRFNVFYGLGVLLNLSLGLIIYAFQPITANLLGGHYYETATMYYVNMSMFFSFATLYPDMRVLLYGIIPLKVKWLAWLDAALFAFDIGYSLTARNWLGAALPTAVKTLLLCGATADKIEAAVKAAPDYAPGKPLLVRFDKLDDVVVWARENAQPGDIVLFSPACASFDQFPNFAARGRYFKEKVNQL